VVDYVKISQLPLVSAVLGADEFEVNEAGTSKKATASQLLSYVETGATLNNLLGTLSVAKGGTGAVTLTGYVYGNGTGAMTASATIPGSAISGNITGNAANVTGTVAATNGGTGQTTYTVGDLLIGGAGNTLTKLADVATGSALISGGVGVAPSWGKVGLTTHVSGTLPVANGGSGAATLTGYVYGNGTGAMTAATTIPGTAISGNITGSAANVTGTVAVTNGGTGAATLTGFVKGNGTSAFTAQAQIGITDISATGTPSASTYLRGDGSWSAVGGGGTVTSVDVSGGTTGLTTSGGPVTGSGTITLAGTLALANGGTGSTTAAGARTNLGLGTAATMAGPTGTIVGTTDTQTLINKTISGASNTLTVDGTNAVGFLNIPQNSQSAAYTLVLSDAGKHILHPAADITARTFTIPANASVAFPIGTAVTFVNQNGAGSVTIAITTDTMRLAGAGTTGSRTLAANGVATAIKIASTEWIISGTGLT